MKILVTHASAGAGHLKAAEAIYNGLQKYTEHDVTFVDALDYSSPLFKKLYVGTYTNLVTYVPWLWGIAFRFLDIPFLQPLIRAFRRIYNTINCGKFHSFLIDEQFDVIFSAHFMPNEVASALKKSGKIKSQIISAVTDYDVHRIWLASHVDKFALGSDWTKERVEKIGVTESKVFATGIPTDEKFSSPKNVPEIKQTLGIRDDLFTILIATGSFGIGPIEEIIEELKSFQIIVVCGHNKKLYKRLSTSEAPHIKVMGLVDNMHELMAASDVMVTKPGGLSVTEALVSQLPLIFFNAIPGQETGNIMVLGKYGIGFKSSNINEIGQKLNLYRTSRDNYLSALKKTKILARPSAVKDIIALIG